MLRVLALRHVRCGWVVEHLAARRRTLIVVMPQLLKERRLLFREPKHRRLARTRATSLRIQLRKHSRRRNNLQTPKVNRKIGVVAARAEHLLGCIHCLLVLSASVINIRVRLLQEYLLIDDPFQMRVIRFWESAHYFVLVSPCKVHFIHVWQR